MANVPKYSDHLDAIVALITHLSYSKFPERTVPNLAKALSIDEAEITYTLDNFKALFRKSKIVSAKTGAHFYALQLRYARQWLEEAAVEESEDEQKPPLDAPSVNALLDFVVKKVDQETRSTLGFGTAWLTTAGSLVIAALAIIFGLKK
jgi:hypothetical protein